MTARRALVLEAGTLLVREQDVPDLDDDQVRLAMQTVGLCSSDVHIWKGRKAGAEGILGHEGAGQVVAVGREVVGWSPGEFAVVNPLLACGACESCRANAAHVCPTREIVGYDGHGLMADVVTLDARSLFRPPAGLDPSLGAMVEPLACVVHAQDRIELPVEDTMAIVGAGPMGALHASYARVRGVGHIRLVDTSRTRLELARSCAVPADELLTSSEADRRSTSDVAVVANSTRAGHQLAADLCGPDSTLLAFASILDEPGALEVRGHLIDTDDIHRREGRETVQGAEGRTTVVGAIGFDAGSFARSAELLAGGLAVDRFVTGRIGLSEVPRLVDDGWHDHLKILIDPTR